jgi:hypothetical protein
MKRIFGFVMVFLFVGGLLSFAQTLNYGTFKPTKQLTISLMTDLSGPPTKPPTEDVVAPVLRTKTGVTAIPFPEPTNLGTSAAAVAQALVAGNNLPDVITESYFPPQVDGQQVLVDAGKVWDFNDMTFLKKMFPNFTTRLNQYGSLDDWYANEGTYNNTHIRITSNIDPNALTKMMASQKGTTYYSKVTWNPGMYPKALRDDILKIIYPKARSGAEQEQFFIKTFNANNPTGASDPYADIPINSMADFYKYMQKAKEIIDQKNLMDGAGRDKMIVAQLNADQGAASIMWSNISMYGYIWTEPPFHVADRAYYNFQEPWVKDVLAWWNKAYNDGLLDPALFVKKNDELGDEITRGRFAIFPDWGAWVNQARKYAVDNKLPYGYRDIICWWPKGTFKNTYNDSSNQWVTYFQHFAANIITKNVSEADLPQVANWLDYHYSEEFDILRSWGPSTFYTGTGKDRRFKPAYRDLANFQAYGITGAKDGYYYGVTMWAPVSLAAGTQNAEITDAFVTNYPYAPQYVYPVVKQAGMNYDAIMNQAVMASYVAKSVNFFPQKGWTNADLNNQPDFAKIQYMWFGTHGPAIAKAIVGTTADFESNYAAYQKVFRDNDWDLGMQEYQLKWKEIFDKYIKQYWK